MHSRIAALEAKLENPEYENNKTIQQVNNSRKESVKSNVNTKVQELSMMTSMSLESLPKPPLFNDNNGNTMNNGLLRTGTDRLDLMVKAQEIYANFLSDVCDLCKKRSNSSLSVEELAMHKSIAEVIRKNFSGFGNIQKIQDEMVAAATEVSLVTK